MERRLAAILAADVVGYSRLMGDDEAGTLRRLCDLRDQVLQPLIADHRGRIVKLMGDGILVEFASVVDSVACALAWQKHAASQQTDEDGRSALQFRIGINVGDVIVEGDDLYGDGVNIAARLEGLADPGGIFLSGDAFRQAKGRIEAAFEDLGEQDLKNIADPVRVYRIAQERSRTGFPSPEKKQLALPEKPSIAVLPFTNMSGDPEQEYFSDGITEDIITSLSRIAWLFVIARNSSFLFKGKAVDVRQVAKELGVRYVLEGSVRKATNRIRITAQLIDARSSVHLWVERYDRDLDDIFEVQDEVVGSIVHALGAHDGVLAKSERQRRLDTQAKNLTAYDFYLQGRERFDRQVDDNFEETEALFRKAIALDAGFAQAYSALAWLHFLRFKLLRTKSFYEIEEEARDLALHAVRLDQNDYQAHWVLGFLNSHMGKHSQSLAQFDRALSINPNDANVLAWSAEGLNYCGRSEEALDRCQRAIRLNPSCPDFYFWLLGFSYFHLGRYNEAAAALERMTTPGYARRLLAATYAHLDRPEEARSEAEAYMKLDPDFCITAWAQTEHYSNPRELQRFVDGLRKAGLPL